MTSKTAWRWELTPRELFDNYAFAKVEPSARVRLEVRPFKAIYQPLDGTKLQFQFGVSESSLAQEVVDILHTQGKDGLKGTGDRRSGVIVLDHMKIVGSLVIPGNLVPGSYQMAVHPEYRRQGIATKMLTEWCWRTKRLRDRPRQMITVHGAKTLLNVHKILVKRAQENGLTVPERVLRAIESGKEEAAIIEAASSV